MRRVAFALAVGVGACASFKTTPTTDCTVLLAPLARSVAKGSPRAPETRTAFDGVAIDQAELDGDAIVVTTMGLHTLADVVIARVPECKKVLAITRKTGAVAWSLDRPPACGDVLLGASSGGLWYWNHDRLSLIGSGGKSIKDITVEKDAVVRRANGRVWIAGKTIAAYDDATGAPVGASLPLAGATPPYRLFVDEGVVLAGGAKGLTVLDATTATVVARLPDVPTLAGGHAPRRLGTATVVVTPKSLVAWSDDGSRKFEVPLAQPPVAETVLADGVLLLERGRIAVIDAAGQPRWEHAFSKADPPKEALATWIAPEAPKPIAPSKPKPKSPPAPATKKTAAEPPAPPADPSLAFATTTKSLLALDLATGEVRTTAPLPAFFHPNRGADRIRVSQDGKSVVVVNGSHLAAFARAGGELVWSLDALTMQTVYPRARAAHLDALRNLAGIKEGKTGDAIVADAARDIANADARVVKHIEFSVKNIGTSNVNTEAAMELGMADAMMAVVQKSFAAGAAFFVGCAVRAEQRLRVSLANEATAFAGDYVVRPIRWSAGEGVLVVRISDGAFTEIVSGPSRRWVEMYGLGSIDLFDASEQELVTAGEGLDPAKWIKDTSYSILELPQPAVLGFHVPGDAFHPVAEYEKTSIVPPGDVE